MLFRAALSSFWRRGINLSSRGTICFGTRKSSFTPSEFFVAAFFSLRSACRFFCKHCGKICKHCAASGFRMPLSLSAERMRTMGEVRRFFGGSVLLHFIGDFMLFLMIGGGGLLCGWWMVWSLPYAFENFWREMLCCLYLFRVFGKACGKWLKIDKKM